MTDTFWIVRTYADNGKLLHESAHTADPGEPRVEVQRCDPQPGPTVLRPEDVDPVYDEPGWYDRGWNF